MTSSIQHCPQSGAAGPAVKHGDKMVLKYIHRYGLLKDISRNSFGNSTMCRFSQQCLIVSKGNWPWIIELLFIGGTTCNWAEFQENNIYFIHKKVSKEYHLSLSRKSIQQVFKMGHYANLRYLCQLLLIISTLYITIPINVLHCYLQI